MTDEPKNLDAILRRIQALLAQADHPNTGPLEAQAFRDKAEQLMTKYRIEESEAAARGEAPSLKPVVRTVVICDYRSRYAMQYRYIFAYAMDHAGVKSVYMRKGEEYLGEAVGFESDVRYAEMLYTAARLVFQDRMEPRIDQSLSDQENVYRLRRSGVERRVVGEMMGWQKSASKVSRLYEAECKRRGEDPIVSGKGFDVKTYRKAYCNSFTDEFWNRLYMARLHRGQDGAIVLRSRQEEVDEAFYQRYPHLRPSTNLEPYDPPEEMTEAEKRKLLKQIAADQAREDRKRATPGYQAGALSGLRAAQEVDLGGQAGRGRIG